MLVSSVQINSLLDSQSRLKMITLFCGRHVGVPHWYTRIWLLHTGLYKFEQYILTDIWSCERRTDFKLGEVTSFLNSNNNTISWLYLPNGFRIIFLLCFIAWQCKPRKKKQHISRFEAKHFSRLAGLHDLITKKSPRTNDHRIVTVWYWVKSKSAVVRPWLYLFLFPSQWWPVVVVSHVFFLNRISDLTVLFSVVGFINWVGYREQIRKLTGT